MLLFLLPAPYIVWQLLFILFIFFIFVIKSDLFFCGIQNIIWLYNHDFFYILGKSCLLAFSAACMVVIISFIFTYIISNFNTKYRHLFLCFFALPYLNNFLVHCAAWKKIFSYNGALNNVLLQYNLIQEPYHYLYNIFIVFFIMIYINMPFGVASMYVAFKGFNKKLMEASYDLGASHLKTIRRVVIPSVRSGFISGFFLVFIPMSCEFGVSELLGGNTYLQLGEMFSLLLYSKDLFGKATTALILYCLLLVFLVLFIYKIIYKCIDWIAK